MSKLGRLAGETVLVTGGGNGIGRAMCKLFAKEGASVAILDIDNKGITETLTQMTVRDGVKHCLIEADISNVEQVKEAFNKAEKELGHKCTVLVNNAGITGKGTPFDGIAVNDFEKVVKVNLKGTFLMTKEFIRILKENDETNTKERGVVVNISSIGGKSGFVFNGEYSASKAGIVGLTKTLTQEYQIHRVRCNAILPGVIDTAMVANANQELVSSVLKTVPMGRVGSAEEVANACLFLASSESSYVNGACLEVTGGAGL